MYVWSHLVSLIFSSSVFVARNRAKIMPLEHGALRIVGTGTATTLLPRENENVAIAYLTRSSEKHVIIRSNMIFRRKLVRLRSSDYSPLAVAHL